MEEFVPNFKEVISIVGEQTLEIMIPISEENYYKIVAPKSYELKAKIQREIFDSKREIAQFPDII